MKRECSGQGHFCHLTFSCDLDLGNIQNFSHDTRTSQGEQLCQVILKSIHKCRRYASDKVNFVAGPSAVTLTFGMTQVLINGNNFAKYF